MERKKKNDMDQEERIKVYNITEEIKGYQKEIAMFKQKINKALDKEEEIMYLANKVAITTQNIEVIAVRDRLEDIFKILKGDSNE